MMAIPSAQRVEWIAPFRAHRGNAPNMAISAGLPFSRIWFFLASAAAHGAVVALLLSDDAEPLPIGQAIVVELVVETAHKPTNSDAAGHPTPLDAANAYRDFDEPIRRIKINATDGRSLPRITPAERLINENIAKLPIESKLLPAVLDPMPGDVSTATSRPLEKSIDSRKRDRSADWTANIPVPRPRPKPALKSKNEQAKLAPTSISRALRPVPEKAPMTEAKPGNGGEPHQIRTGRPAKMSPKGADTPGQEGANFVARQGSAKKVNVGSGGLSDATQIPGNPSPRYPSRAVRRGWQGRVILDVEVLPSGKPGAIGIALSSGHGVLDRSARDTVRKWQFKAARRAGIPFRSKVRVPVQFKLEK
jgi:protein TonB